MAENSKPYTEVVGSKMKEIGILAMVGSVCYRSKSDEYIRKGVRYLNNAKREEKKLIRQIGKSKYDGFVDYYRANEPKISKDEQKEIFKRFLGIELTTDEFIEAYCKEQVVIDAQVVETEMEG